MVVNLLVLYNAGNFLKLYICQLCKKDCALVSLVILKFIKSLLLTWASLTLCAHYILTDIFFMVLISRFSDCECESLCVKCSITLQ